MKPFKTPQPEWDALRYGYPELEGKTERWSEKKRDKYGRTDFYHHTHV